MNLEKFPWLTEVVSTYKNLNFPSSIIIEGESGLARGITLLIFLHRNYYAQMILRLVVSVILVIIF